jgi:ABC-type multidrug transport system fused ATPase/permease subunit
VTRLIRLWGDMLRLSWKRAPWLSLGAVTCLAGKIAATSGSALALRYAVNAAEGGMVRTAIIGGGAAAMAYAILIVTQDTTDVLILTISDRVGRMDIHPELHRSLATIEGLGHLEQPEFLDRVTLVRKAGGRVAAGMWNASKSAVSIINLALMLALLGSVNGILVLLVAVAALPLFLNSRGQREITRANLKTADQYRLQQHLLDLSISPGSGKELRVAGAGLAIADRQAAAWRESMSLRFRAQVKAAAWTLLGWTIFVVALAAGLVMAAYQVSHGQGTAGDLVLVVTIAATLRASVQSTVESITAAAGSRQFIVSYLWLADYTAQGRKLELSHVEPPARLSDGIVLDGVSYTYPGAPQAALARTSLHLPAGSVIALVGEYGSGKTTLVKLLCKFYQPTTGRILVDGVDLADIAAEAWWERSTAAFQDYGRFHATFAENVGLGNLPDLLDDDRILDALSSANALELIGDLPDGLHSQLGRQLGGVDLSEGQWQRAALARSAMRSRPVLLVLDEPTASLDAPSERAVYENYIRRAREIGRKTGAVTVIVSHRFATVTEADAIAVFEKGRLTEFGRHADLVSRGGLYSELYHIQADAYRVS